MKTTLRFFGPLTDIFPASIDIEIETPTSLEELEERLRQDFPKLEGWNLKIAVDQKIASSDTIIEEAAEIALLPPFSGG